MSASLTSPLAAPLSPGLTLFPTSPQQRSALWTTVVGAHLLAGMALWGMKQAAPQTVEMPMMVEMLASAPAMKPAPAKPEPTPPKPQPKVVKPVQQTLATTTSQQATQEARAEPTPPTPAPPAPSTSSSQRASEGVTQARFDADYLKNPAPPYPALSRRLGEEGKVLLRVLVTPQGTAETVQIKTSSGSTRLDESAQATVARWRFVPARQGEQAVSSWVLVPIIFKLEN